MYEKLTDRARKVMQLANQEAQRFNHEYIGTEHILLGLLRVTDGVAAHVLMPLDIKEVRQEILSLVLPSGKDPNNQTPVTNRGANMLYEAEQVKAGVDQLDKAVIFWQDKYHRLRDSRGDTEKASGTNWQGIVGCLRAQLAQTSASYDLMTAERDEYKKLYDEANRNLHNFDAAALQEEFLKKYLAGAKRRIDGLNEDITRLVKARDDAEATVDLAQEEIDRLRRDEEARMADLNGAYAEIKDLEQQLKQANKTIEFDEEVILLNEKDIDELTRQLETAKRYGDGWQAAAEDRFADFERAEKRAKVAEARVDELTIHLRIDAKLPAGNAEEFDWSVLTRIDELTRHLADAIQSSDSWQAEAAALRADNQKLQADLTIARDELWKASVDRARLAQQLVDTKTSLSKSLWQNRSIMRPAPVYTLQKLKNTGSTKCEK